MNYIEELFVKNWPTWLIVAFSAGGVYRRVVSTEKKVNEIKKNCADRFKWCLDHFKLDKPSKFPEERGQ